MRSVEAGHLICLDRENPLLGFPFKVTGGRKCWMALHLWVRWLSSCGEEKQKIGRPGYFLGLVVQSVRVSMQWEKATLQRTLRHFRS